MIRATPLLLLFAVLVVTACPGRDTPPPETGDTVAEPGPAKRLVGLASFTADMLRRGAGQRSTEEIAEAIEYVGGDLSIETEADSTTIEIRVLREHLELAMELLGDLGQNPTFPEDEIERLRRQELDRLALMKSRPRWLASNALHLALYGDDHPYGHYDATPESIAQITRDHLQAFHADNYVPRNAMLITVGDVESGEVSELAGRYFASWEDRPAPPRPPLEVPEQEGREIIVVDVPGSTQAQISIGDIALRRSDPDYIPLRVANQVLGGSASARLFMNLREQCSYSYGVYSRVYSRLAPAPLSIGGAVESQHTAGALREIFSEIERIRSEPIPSDDLGDAKAYMVGHFPLLTETAGNLAYLVTLQRVLELPANYWSTYRSSISAVTAEQARQMAQRYFDPERVTVVIVGDASQVAEPARRWGTVTVVGLDGTVQRQLEAASGQWPGGEPPPCPEPAASGEVERSEQPPEPSEPRDLDFPPLNDSSLDNGLQLLTIEREQLPLVYVRLVIRSGSAADPL